jgi:hypothetical protein
VNIKIYAYIALAVVMAALAAGIEIQTARLHATQAAYDSFKEKVELIGRNQIEANKLRVSASKQLKARIDVENAKLRDDLAAASERLRIARASSSFLPAIPGVAAGATVTADRAGLEAALRNFDTGVARIIDEGNGAVVDLNAAKQWAQEQGKLNQMEK